MAVVALAHPQEVGGEADRLARCGVGGVDGPEVRFAGPGRGVDPVPVADMRAEVVLVDDLAHVFQDFRCRRDRRGGPGLEAVAEGVEVAVGADARIVVRDPGAAEAFLRFEHDEAGAGALVGEVVGAAHAGDAGADDQDVEMLGLCACCAAARGRVPVSGMAGGLSGACTSDWGRWRRFCPAWHRAAALSAWRQAEPLRRRSI